MNRPLQISLVAALSLAAFGAGAWFASSRTASTTAATARRVLYYHDPMHPAYRSDKPGTAPDCGMALEPVYSEGPSSAPAIPGTVQINSETQHLIGIRTASVERAASRRSLRTTGRVSVDETQIYRLTSATDGWVLKTFPKATGDLVRKGEPLLTYYSRDFLGAQQAYFYSLDSLERFRQAGPVSEQQTASIQAQIQQNKEALLALGMGDQQISEIATTHRLTQEVFLIAPVDGFILARNISPGMRFDRGVEFYRVADLGRVWILADLYENEAGRLPAGAAATVRWQGKTLHARRTGAPAQFDAVSRTMRVRFEVDNPGAALRPDMFVDVEVALDLPDALTVPADAVVDSGRRKIVYVDRGNGMFEPRPVETGWRDGDRIAISQGLDAGDRVVAGGSFLLDSESRLQLAAAGAAPADEKDPVCGMPVASDKYAVTHEGKTRRFCSPNCKRDFEAHPERYMKRGAS